MAKLLLFDVDGTLILTGGAGMRGMDRAFQEIYGVSGAFRGVHLAGRTDPGILADAMAQAGVSPGDGAAARFQQVYFRMLQDEVNRPAAEGSDDPTVWRRFKGVYPGVRETLDALVARDDVFLALLTGNFTRAAEIKLAYFDLWRYFRCGAFGEDGAERWHLVQVAIDRARALGSPEFARSDVLVIGDTPLDVEAARLAGVRSLAVATGGFGIETLEQSGADKVVDRMSVRAIFGE
jgi:phosphoglycolate phosphatase